jgi:hypothetical protein
MTTIDRRAMLKFLLGSAATATAGLTLVPGSAESAPLASPAGTAVETDSPVEKAIFVSRRAGRRPSRRPRRKCWYHHGKKVCSTHYHR